MKTEKEIPESQLHLFVDGELDPAEAKAVLEALDEDEALRMRVSQLQHLKALVKHQYPLPDIEGTPREQITWNLLRRRGTMAASILILVTGMVLGWSGHRLSDGKPLLTATPTAARTPTDTITQSNKILLHIDDNNRGKLQALIAYTEALLKNNPQPGLQIEVVANAGGLELLRTGSSPEKQKLRELSRQYSNLELFACANAIARLREKGVEVELIPEAHTGASALDHIVERMQAGWRYHKI